jgi:serine/threonine-protein kinase RsbW
LGWLLNHDECAVMQVWQPLQLQPGSCGECATRDHQRRPVYSQTLLCKPESAGLARRLVTDAFRAWGLGVLTESATSCVTELVANAAQHSGARIIRVTASRPSDRRVRVSVSEKGRRLLLARNAASQDDEHGRGLILINALSDRWGADLVSWGKHVWCEFATACANERAGHLTGSSGPMGRCVSGDAC